MIVPKHHGEYCASNFLFLRAQNLFEANTLLKLVCIHWKSIEKWHYYLIPTTIDYEPPVMKQLLGLIKHCTEQTKQGIIFWVLHVQWFNSIIQ